MVVLLYKSGIPVKLSEKFSKLEFDIEGFLIGFTFKENTLSDSINYRFYFKAEFKTNDKKRSDLIDAYYDETQFLKYIENTGPDIPLGRDMIFKYKFNFDKYLARPGDSISVGVTNFNAPYDFFYDRKKYEFKIESTLDNKGIRSYSDSTTEGFEKIDYILRLPNKFTSQTISVPITPANRFGYHFYNKNLGNYINQYSNDADKRKLKKIVILIIFKIREIVEDIFPMLLSDEGSDLILEGVC
ncbi:hypothetical protein [Flavobacterium ginsengisoli]|uniref:hypothetical protein n=1 Tax=Flavobacterium ginsengisoli TaxID=871694 RepID=UPI00241547D3|nr:hypothetical protein [Flavobacterium ginsengisoli]